MEHNIKLQNVMEFCDNSWIVVSIFQPFLQMSQMQNFANAKFEQRDGHGKWRNGHGKIMEIFFCKVCENPDLKMTTNMPIVMVKQTSPTFMRTLLLQVRARRRRTRDCGPCWRPTCRQRSPWSCWMSSASTPTTSRYVWGQPSGILKPILHYALGLRS